VNNLDAVVAAAEIMQKLSIADCQIVVSNVEKVIYVLQPVSFKAPSAEEIIGTKPRGLLAECLEKKQVTRGIIPKSYFGVPLKNIACPIFDDDGQLLGACACGFSMETQESLHSTAHAIAATAEEITAATQELGATASYLAQELGKVRIGSESVLTKIKKTDDILKFISDVAANSNLLGLIAAAKPVISLPEIPFSLSAVRKDPICAWLACPDIIIPIACSACSREKCCPSSKCAK